MSDIKIIVGRAGSGKSSYCIKEISEYIKNREDKIGGAAAFLIVPEQLSVQAERRLLCEANLDGLLRDEVLSFKRAAYRVLGNKGGLKYELLTPSGKIMILTQAIKDVEGQLEFYASHATKPRGMEAILQLIEEFGRYGASAEKLRELSLKDETDSLLKLKLHDLSIIYEAYRSLTTGRYYDSETLYGDMICELPKDKTFAGAHVWIDGFGGFTSQEYDIISGLFKLCASVTISICTDRAGGRTFDNPNETCKILGETANRCGFNCTFIELDDADKIPPRFAENKYLAHLEKYYNTYPYKVAYGSDTGIHVTECGNLYYEIAECAQKIVDLRKQGIKYSEIAVVSGDLSLYGNAAGAVFPSFNIPYFVDEKRGIDIHPLIRYILDLLELVSSNWAYMSVFSFLKTGLYETNTILIDKLENDILAKGIKGKNGKKGWKSYVERYCDEDSAEGCQNQIHILAKRLFDDVENLKKELKQCKNISECCCVLVDFLKKNNIYDKVANSAYVLRLDGRLDEADEYSRIWNIVIEVIDQANKFLGDIKIGSISAKATFLQDILSNGFSQYKAGFIPHSVESVQIGTPERSKSLNPKVLFILGANEGVFPKAVSDTGLLSDSDREYMLENGILLSDDNRKRVFYADFVVYTVLSSASKELYISYSLADVVGDTKRPSSIVRNILKLFPDMQLAFGENDSLHVNVAMTAGDGSKTSDVSVDSTDISENVAVKLLGLDAEEIPLSVSRIEKYNQCPYSFLLDYGLKIKPRKEYAMEAVDIGSLMHSVIEKASKVAAEDENGIKNLDRKKCEDIVNSVFDEAVLEVSEEGDIFLGTERSAYITAKMKRIASNELDNISNQLKLNMLKPYGFEMMYGYDDDDSLPPVEVDCSEGFKVLLRGKIDRVDVGIVAEDMQSEPAVYFRVIDYKSSAKNVTVGDIVNGIKIQLITYIEAVSNGLAKMPEYKDKKIVPASAFYYVFEKDVEKLSERFDGNFAEVESDKFMKGLYLAKEDLMYSLHGGAMDIPKNIMGSQYAVPEGGFEKLFDSAKVAVKKSAENMKKGKFPVRPIINRDGTMPCRFCDYCSVCRVHSDAVAQGIRLDSVSASEYWSS